LSVLGRRARPARQSRRSRPARQSRRACPARQSRRARPACQSRRARPAAARRDTAVDSAKAQMILVLSEIVVFQRISLVLRARGAATPFVASCLRCLRFGRFDHARRTEIEQIVEKLVATVTHAEVVFA